MSTFLELVQDLHSESGAAGVAPTSVSGQTGEAKRLVDWIRRADLKVKRLWENWKFMRTTYSQATTDTINTLPKPAGLKFWDVSPEKNTFRCVYVGETEDSLIETVEYDEVKDEILDTDPGEPSRIIIMPDNSLLIEPTPNGAHTIKADYYQTAESTKLVNNDDVSIIPEEFHDVILARAMIFYANYENAPEIKTQGTELYTEVLARLENSQLPNKFNSRFRTGGFFEVIASQ
jgi:hypothetical protein